MNPTEFAPAPFASGEPTVSGRGRLDRRVARRERQRRPVRAVRRCARVVRRHQRCAQRACTHGTRVSSAGSSRHHHHPSAPRAKSHRQHHPLPDGHITPPSPSGELSRASLLPDFTCVARRRTWGEPMGNPSTDKVAWPLTSRPVNDPSSIRFGCVEVPASGSLLGAFAVTSQQRAVPTPRQRSAQGSHHAACSHHRAAAGNPRAFGAGCVYSAMDAVSGEDLAHETAPMGYV